MTGLENSQELSGGLSEERTVSGRAALQQHIERLTARLAEQVQQRLSQDGRKKGRTKSPQEGSSHCGPRQYDALGSECTG